MNKTLSLLMAILSTGCLYVSSSGEVDPPSWDIGLRRFCIVTIECSAGVQPNFIETFEETACMTGSDADDWIEQQILECHDQSRELWASDTCDGLIYCNASCDVLSQARCFADE